jgi:pimeloyl-ACP methyl ester carboxylesterase
MWKKVCHISESLNSLVIACDLEGHGYSDGPQSIENCENLVQDVVDLCTDLTSTSAGSTFSTDLGSLKRTLLHQKLILGGESFGGAIALQASLQWQSIPQLKGFLVVIAVD